MINDRMNKVYSLWTIDYRLFFTATCKFYSFTIAPNEMLLKLSPSPKLGFEVSVLTALLPVPFVIEVPFVL